MIYRIIKIVIVLSIVSCGGSPVYDKVGDKATEYIIERYYTNGGVDTVTYDIMPSGSIRIDEHRGLLGGFSSGLSIWRKFPGTEEWVPNVVRIKILKKQNHEQDKGL